MAITGRTALVAALGVLLAPLGAVWSLAVVGLLALAVAADVALAGRIADLRMERSGGTTTRLGQPVEVALLVTNAGRRRVRGLLRDAWLPSAGATPRIQQIDVPPGERRRLATTLVPTRRGDRIAAHVTVRSLGPLGLAGRQRRHQVPWAVRVLPPFTSRKFLPEKLARLRELDGAVTLNRRGQGTEFDSLREYVDGDDVRSIDWRATARSADVMVRTWRPERDRRILLVLDTGRTSAARVGDAPRLDAAMDAALLLAALAARAGDRVDLLAYDRRIRSRVEGEAPTSLLPALVQAMAPLDPALIETDYAGMVATVLARSARRSLVVLLTTLDPAPVEEGLLPVLAPLVRRHTVILASVGDPRVGKLAGRRGDVESVYGAAAAARAGQDRRRVAEVLERRGVEVVDAPPDELPPLLSDRYLALKAAGRL